MKKVVVAFVAGVLLATAGSVYAEDIKSLVGQSKKIQAEVFVKVDGKKADKTGIIIDGTTYLPVRSIGNALDMNVSYSKTEVELTSKGGPTVDPETPTEMSQDDQEAIKSAEEQILISQNKIIEYNEKVSSLENDLKAAEKKVDEATSYVEKNLAEGDISSAKNAIDATNQLLQAAKDNIVSQQSFIDKIKKKYEQ